jgi:hypothetical protein
VRDAVQDTYNCAPDRELNEYILVCHVSCEDLSDSLSARPTMANPIDCCSIPQLLLSLEKQLDKHIEERRYAFKVISSCDGTKVD